MDQPSGQTNIFPYFSFNIFFVIYIKIWRSSVYNFQVSSVASRKKSCTDNHLHNTPHLPPPPPSPTNNYLIPTLHFITGRF